MSGDTRRASSQPSEPERVDARRLAAEVLLRVYRDQAFASRALDEAVRVLLPGNKEVETASLRFGPVGGRSGQ